MVYPHSPYVTDEQKSDSQSTADHDTTVWRTGNGYLVASLQRFLRDAAEKDIEGEYQLYDNSFSFVDGPARRNNKTANTLNDRERAYWRVK